MENPKSILITGASSGIGQALALSYAASDSFLTLNGRNAERLKMIADQCRARGATVYTCLVDVTNAEAMNEWIVEANNKHPLDLVIANAGISGGTGMRISGEPVSEARQIFDINVNGVFNTVEPILTILNKRNATNNKPKGQIAIVSSLAGFRGWPSAPAYSASKGAVRFYGEAMRGVLSKQNIEINVICPGFVTSRITDANDFSMPMKMDADKAAKIIKKGLNHNKGRIAFPWPVYFISWLISTLPDALAQILLSKAPAKKPSISINSEN